MAGLASIAFTLIILLSSASAKAGDLFTGFHMDDNAEYFTYLGLKEDLPGEFSGLKGFVQLFASGQSYEYESNNQDIEADVQSLTPSLGVAKSLGGGRLDRFGTRRTAPEMEEGRWVVQRLGARFQRGPVRPSGGHVLARNG